MRAVKKTERRIVVRVALAYAAAGWLILQVADAVLPAFEAAPGLLRSITVILMAGFPVAVVLAWFFGFAAGGVRREPEVERDDAGSGRWPGRFDLIVIGMLIAAAGVLVLDKYILTARAPVAAPREPSIAVLPFLNASSDPAQTYFSDGFSEDIINCLARAKQLEVAGRHSAFAFRRRQQDLRLISDLLGVAHVARGSVRKSGPTLRVTAQLVAVDDGSVIWSDVFETRPGDVFAIQEDIARAILYELSPGLRFPQQPTPTVTPTDSEAYDLYLRARQRIDARTRPMLQSAVTLLDRSIRVDPSYAPAHAQRGIAELLLVEGRGRATPPREALARSKAWLDRSLALDANLAEGWAGLGLYYLTVGNERQRAVEALRKAVALNPGLVGAKNRLRDALDAAGDVGAAHAMAEKLARQDPLYGPAFSSAVGSYNRFGEHDKAFALIDRVKQFLPDDPAVLAADAITHLYLGHVATAYPLLETTVERLPDDAEVRAFFGFALIATRQFERLAIDGGAAQRIAALDRLGRTERAAELARRLADDGHILPLLQHYNRNGRSELLISFIDRQWPDPGAFEAAFPHDAFGHEEMAELALAYSRAADPRFEDALRRVGRATDKLASLGIDNWIFERNRAIYRALAADTERALASLGEAIDGGYRDIVPLATARPAFVALSSDPRFDLLELQMRRHARQDRELLGLPR